MVETAQFPKQHLPWPFSQPSRPFTGDLKALHTSLFWITTVLNDMVMMVLEIQEHRNEERLLKLETLVSEADGALRQLDLLCINAASQGTLRFKQRRLVASILRAKAPLHLMVKGCAGLGRRFSELPSGKSCALPSQVRSLGVEAQAMVVRSLEAFVVADCSLARTVLEQESWITHLSRSSYSRLAQIMLMDRHAVEWAATCHFVVNYWEEIAASAIAIAQESLIAHQESTGAVDPRPSPAAH